MSYVFNPMLLLMYVSFIAISESYFSLFWEALIIVSAWEIFIQLIGRGGVMTPYKEQEQKNELC